MPATPSASRRPCARPWCSTGRGGNLAYLEGRAKGYEMMGDHRVANALRERAPAIVQRMFEDIT